MDWIPYANFVLNLLLLPLLKILWDIKNGLTSLESTVKAHAERIDRLERIEDTR